MANRIRGGVQVPAFLRYEPEWYRWGAGSIGKKVAVVAGAILLPVVGQAIAIGVAAADSAELALAKKLQEHIVNLPMNTPFNTRKDQTTEALRILKILKRNRASKEDAHKINSIMMNLCGQELRSLINDIEDFTAEHGTNANPRTIDNAKIGAYTFKKTKEAIKEVKRLIETLEKLDKNDLQIVLDKAQYLQAQGGVDGLRAYKQALETRENTIDGAITAQKSNLRRIIRGANRAYVSEARKQSLLNNMTPGQEGLAQVRAALTLIDPALNDKEAFKALGMKGYDDHIGNYLGGVQTCIEKGYASGDISDSELGRLSRQSFSIIIDGGAGIAASTVSFWTTYAGLALYGATLGAGGLTAGAGAWATVATGGAFAIAATVGTLGGFVGGAIVNYMRGGGLYQSQEG